MATGIYHFQTNSYGHSNASQDFKICALAATMRAFSSSSRSSKTCTYGEQRNERQAFFSLETLAIAFLF